jgi:predicted nucleic acid-binding protein
MYQVVIDTNVLVAGLLSSLGASHRLLRLVGDDRWRINLSVPLVLEYEQTLKRVCTGESLSGSDIDDVLYSPAPRRICVTSSSFGARFCSTRRTTSCWNWPWKAGPIS